LFKKKIKSGEQIYPEMVSIIVDEVNLEGEEYYSVSYMLYIDEDLSNSRVIELGTTLNSEESVLDAALIAIEYAESLWSLESIYPSVTVRGESGIKGHALIVDILKEYQKQLYNKEESLADGFAEDS
jgi:disulfide oxidoreductase YuzD